MHSLVIFEDNQVSNLNPLTLTRPAFDLQCGARLLWQKVADQYPQAQLHFWVRGEMADLVRAQKHSKNVNQAINSDALFINARVLFDDTLARQIPLQGEDKCFFQNDTLVAVRVSAPKAGQLSPGFNSLTTH